MIHEPKIVPSGLIQSKKYKSISDRRDILVFWAKIWRICALFMLQQMRYTWIFLAHER